MEFLLSANPCNCGTCANVPGSYRCNCDQWTTGVHCEVDIDECQNHSLCNKRAGQAVCYNYNAVSEYSCDDPQRKGYSCFQGNLACVGGGREVEVKGMDRVRIVPHERARILSPTLKRIRNIVYEKAPFIVMD